MYILINILYNQKSILILEGGIFKKNQFGYVKFSIKVSIESKSIVNKIGIKLFSKIKKICFFKNRFI